MTRLGDLIAGVKPPPPFVHGERQRTEPPPDNCGCPKPRGCWGIGGIHFRMYGQLDIEREISQALASLPAGGDDNSRRIVEASTTKWCKLYEGTHVAYEQCPAYYAAVKREIEERKSQQRRQNSRSELLGD